MDRNKLVAGKKEIERNIVKVYREAMSQEIVHQTMNELLSRDDPYQFQLHREIESASWLNLPPSKIYIPSKLYSEDLSFDENVEKFRIIMRHEMCHHAWTERDFQVISRVLESSGSAHSVYNIFEDARIESRYRKKFNEPFGWTRFFRTPVFSDYAYSSMVSYIPEAYEIMLMIIQHEGFESLKARPSDNKRLNHRIDRVIDYYKKICECDSIFELEPLLKLWSQEFGPLAAYEGDLGFSDALMATPASEWPSVIKIFEEESIDIEDSQADQKVSEISEKMDVETFNSIKRSAKLLSDRRNITLIQEKVAVIADRLESLLTQHLTPKVKNSKSGGKRISARHLGLGEIRYRVKRPVEARSLEMNLIFDCSGSMGGPAHEEGAHLVAALNSLAKKGLVEGNLILSKISDSNAMFQTIPMPFEDDDVPERISCNGSGEGIHHAIMKNADLIKKKKCLFVYTDADIADDALATRKYNSKGIFPFGLYVDKSRACGSSGSAEMANMIEHFNNYLIRETAESLAESMAQRKSLVSKK